jgi:hypothetical protein
MIDFLYKYRRIDEHLEHLISNCEVYFRSPDQFDDPFDCKAHPYPEDLPAVVQSLQSRFKDEFLGKFSTETDEFVRFIADPNTMKEPFFEDWTRRVASIRSKAGIFCLSETNISIPMWSLYADGHKGACLQFRVTTDPFFQVLGQVQYSRDYPTFRFSQGDLVGYLFKQLLFKSDQWAYQREWRIIKSANGAGFFRFPPDSLTGIIFGCLASHSDMERIMLLAKDRIPSISFYQTKMVQRKFELQLVPLK